MLLRRAAAVLAALLALLAAADALYVYSSFWAPLFDRRILNYRVDAPFDPDAGRRARGPYEARYGVRGSRLIADLGNGKGPGDNTNKGGGDVRAYYIYNGANHNTK